MLLDLLLQPEAGCSASNQAQLLQLLQTCCHLRACRRLLLDLGALKALVAQVRAGGGGLEGRLLLDLGALVAQVGVGGPEGY